MSFYKVHQYGAETSNGVKKVLNCLLDVITVKVITSFAFNNIFRNGKPENCQKKSFCHGCGTRKLFLVCLREEFKSTLLRRLSQRYWFQTGESGNHSIEEGRFLRLQTFCEQTLL